MPILFDPLFRNSKHTRNTYTISFSSDLFSSLRSILFVYVPSLLEQTKMHAQAQVGTGHDSARVRHTSCVRPTVPPRKSSPGLTVSSNLFRKIDQ
jgi:hypothetical protein